MSWISGSFRWCVGIHDDLSMSVTLCWCAVFQGELQQSSNCKPLWFLTCVLRAHCTWCYLFKAICTDDTFLLPPLHLPHTTPDRLGSPRWLNSPDNQSSVAVPAITRQEQAIYGVSSPPYWGFLPCHMWSFLQTIYRYIEFVQSLKRDIKVLLYVCVKPQFVLTIWDAVGLKPVLN